MILSAQSINKSYTEAGDGSQAIQVLKNFSLEIQEGESLAIMGPSGCGKSTLVSILGGLDQPDRGQVKIAEQDLYQLSANALTDFRAQNIGVIFQQFHLLPHLKAIDNVRLPLDLQGDDRAEEKAREALRSVGLAERAEHFPHQMSRGECQRTAIARVLVMEPKIVFADEPTGSLDRRTADEVMEILFQRLKEKNIALVLVTHDEQVAQLCERRLSL